MDSLFPGRRTTVAIHSERPKPAGKPCLIVISGPGLGQRTELGAEDVEIGRSESCTLCISSDQVSRRHANVLRIAGQYVVTIIWPEEEKKVKAIGTEPPPDRPDRLRGKYADQAKALLTAEVKAGTNQLEPFHLE